jgi:Ni,Fe-hydrogenase III small subunit
VVKVKVRVRVRVVNLGSCNGCELEILDLLYLEPALCLCERDEEADVILLTGALTEANRARAERVQARSGVPVLRVGSCGISQGIFLPPDGALDRVGVLGGCASGLVLGCPPPSTQIAETLRALEKERESDHT